MTDTEGDMSMDKCNANPVVVLGLTLNRVVDKGNKTVTVQSLWRKGCDSCSHEALDTEVDTFMSGALYDSMKSRYGGYVELVMAENKHDRESHLIPTYVSRHDGAINEAIVAITLLVSRHNCSVYIVCGEEAFSDEKAM